MIDWDRIDNYRTHELQTLLYEIGDILEEKLHKLRSGVYDEGRHGDLRETLEELEGLF